MYMRGYGWVNYLHGLIEIDMQTGIVILISAKNKEIRTFHLSADNMIKWRDKVIVDNKESMINRWGADKREIGIEDIKLEWGEK